MTVALLFYARLFLVMVNLFSTSDLLSSSYHQVIISSSFNKIWFYSSWLLTLEYLKSYDRSNCVKVKVMSRLPILMEIKEDSAKEVAELNHL